MTGMRGHMVDVADVRRHHPIEDVVAAEGIGLRRVGTGWMACCPFHDDATASLSVAGVPDRFHCFGCGASGDVIDFIGRLHGLGFREAVAHLDRTLPDRTPLRTLQSADRAELSPARAPHRVDPERAYAINALAWQWFSRPVAHEHAMAYLRHHRRIDLRQAELQTGTCYAGHTGHGWTPLVDHLHGEGVTDEELLSLDLAQPTRHGTLIDTLRDRLVIPVTDHHGHVTGFVGRDTSGHPRAPKYRNPSHTTVFDKATCLYRPTRTAVSDAQVIVVEGVLDALAITAAVATAGALEHVTPVSALGTAVSAAQARQVMGQSTGSPVIALDGDQAGHQGTLRWIDAICRHGGQLALVSSLPAGADPADWLARHGADGLRSFLPRVRLGSTTPPELRGSGPRLPGREIAVLACQGPRPLATAAADLTRLSRRLDNHARRELLEGAAAEMTRQGWNPNGAFTRAMQTAVPAHNPGGVALDANTPTCHQL